jgi:hypothetical protein
MANDYPDGFRRLLPGHTVDLESGFARPWYMGETLNIAAGNYSTYTITITDPDSIYYIDVVNVSPQSYTEFGVRVFINSIPYVAEGCIGFAHIPMRVNPSLLLIYGDVIVVEVTNFDASLRQFLVKVHGTKISRPAAFGHVPGAYFTSLYHIVDSLVPSYFADGSTYSPTSWDWNWQDGTSHSTSQNAYHVYKIPGSYYPLLKAINAYGYDTYAEQSPVVCNANLVPSIWNEYDPNSHITKTDTNVTITTFPADHAGYVNVDCIYREIHGFIVMFMLQTTLMQVSSRHCFMKFGNTLGSEVDETIGSVGVEIRPVAGHNNLLLRAYLPSGAIQDEYVDIPVDGTPLYFKMHHPSGSDTVSLSIYSDVAQTILLDILTITNTAFKTMVFRYVYLTRAWGTVITGQTTAVITPGPFVYL